MGRQRYPDTCDCVMSRSEATNAQINAADPKASTWVSANAGSGKTRVLTDRVARLLLRRTDPQKILCLTYTKAAAAEMQNRLFSRLGSWAMMPDADLQMNLQELGEEGVHLSQRDLQNARRLFASALETPGGLKIQTIHSFCDALLRRFPLEAGVSPQFSVMEERQAKQLRADILEDMAGGQAVAAFDQMARFFTGDDPEALLYEIIRERTAFLAPVVPADFGVNEMESAEIIANDAFLGGEELLLSSLIELMNSSSTMDKKNAKKLAYALSVNHTKRLVALETVLLFGETAKSPFAAKTDQLPTKALRLENPALTTKLNALMQRVEAARERRINLLAFEKTVALHGFAAVFLDMYDNRKTALGLLDFEDLIRKSHLLLTQSDTAAWVLYRLDGGIDHILVDEAQDTSPAQWQVIAALAQEFTAGQGAVEKERTMFVVGDPKQSIYSFQGADPEAFGEMRGFFATRLQQSDARLKEQDLLFSFRSASPILQLVDDVFGDSLVQGMQGRISHQTFNKDQPGRVEIWPFLEPQITDEKPPWYAPVDSPGPDDPKQILACQVAMRISEILNGDNALPDNGRSRAIRAGDILILVQSRGRLFHALIKEMKRLNLPVAGADRLEVGAELAVRDILSLLKFAATPEDDLSLAEAMRSPLLGFSEADLYNLAQGRERQWLWQVLRQEASRFPEQVSLLRDLLKQADFLRPYEMIERILTHHKTRENLIARLGSEAEDGIDELLSQTLDYEQVEAPSLPGFLHWFQSGSVNKKRQMDSSANQIRVMTVHGAKGLEAPIVILPDTARQSNRDRDQTIRLNSGLLSWKTDRKTATAAQIAAQQRRQDLAAQERMRLLYVALTRAENWLIICGAGQKDPTGADWYSLVSAAMAKGGAQSLHPANGEAGLALETPNWGALSSETHNEKSNKYKTLPDWISQPAPKPSHQPMPLSPSDLGGMKSLSDPAAEGDDAGGMRHGRQMHLLLEYLPSASRDQWSVLAKRLLASGPDSASDAEIQALLESAAQLLSAPHLQAIFAPGALAEVPITARVPQLGDQIIFGFIDRLIITPTRIQAVDFKSNAIVPTGPEQVPEGVLRQMGAYLIALQQIYPDREVSLEILWTSTARLMKLPHDIVRAALESTPTS